MKDQDIKHVLRRLGIVPGTYPIMTAEGIAWRASFSEDEWQHFRTAQHDPYGNVTDMEVTNALVRLGYASLRANLVDMQDAVRIINAIREQRFPKLAVTYTGNVLRLHKQQGHLHMYRPPNPKTGKPRHQGVYYDVGELVALAEKRINPHVTLGRQRKRPHANDARHDTKEVVV